VLEIQQFLREYALYDGRRAGKDWEAFKAANDGKTILKDDHYNTALAVSEAVKAHPVAGPLFRGQGRNELTIQWTHDSGTLCKARIDRLGTALIDLKTARDVSPAGFGRACANYGYVTQLAFYADAAKAAGLGVFPVRIVVVQKVAPYDVAVYDINDDQLEVGRREYEKALGVVAKCKASGVWPGVAPVEPLPLQLPVWSQLSIEDDITFNGEAIV
jgi:exodeoxyribonuclease VIII